MSILYECDKTTEKQQCNGVQFVRAKKVEEIFSKFEQNSGKNREKM